MKNLKLLIATFTIIFAVFVSTANENHEKYQPLLETELENAICPTEVSPDVTDMEMREEYNTLNTEEDALFEFETLHYLPEDFNAFDEGESILAAHELLNTEADEAFDFNTLDYLPVDFYAYH